MHEECTVQQRTRRQAAQPPCETERSVTRTSLSSFTCTTLKDAALCMTIASSALQEMLIASSPAAQKQLHRRQPPAASEAASAQCRAARTTRAPRRHRHQCARSAAGSGHEREEDGRSGSSRPGAATVARSRSTSEAAAGNRRCGLRTQLRGGRSRVRLHAAMYKIKYERCRGWGAAPST